MVSKLKFEYKITAAYLVIGGLWIVFSDNLVEYFAQDKDLLTHMQTFKGWFYVVITATIFFLFLKRHIDRLRKAQQKAEESDQLKSAFLRNVSHEVRTPMNSIVGFSEMLNDPDLSPQKRREYSTLIEQSTTQLLSVITDIVNVSIIESGQEFVAERDVKLNELLEELCDRFELSLHDQDIAIELNCPLEEEEAFVKVDKAKLTTILSNLLGNSLKFTKQGFIHFGYTKKGEFLEFYVKDSGIGIPPDLHGEIFDGFYQVEHALERTYGGVGLGLTISKAYVEMLGGTIWLTSEFGSGSVFYFTIPYKKAEVLKDARSESKPAPSEVILVVEDDTVNFILMNDILVKSNYIVLHALNGSEAVEICKSDQRIDLIFMDIKMPIMDGYEATRLIKGIRPSLPIIAQTAYSMDDDKAKVLSCGCSDFLSKPFNQKQVLEKVSEYLLKH